MNKEEEEKEITICLWQTYEGKRCKRESKNNKYCKVHNIIIKDYILINNENNKDENSVECNTITNLNIIPRSRDHLKDIMNKINYDGDYIVAVVNNEIETGQINDDYIEMTSDQTKYYFSNDTSTRGKYKAKDIKIRFVKHCDNTPIVYVNEEYYCKECYIKKSNKKGFPILKLLSV